MPAVDNAALSETAFRSIVAEKAQASRMATNTSIDPTRSQGRLVLRVATVQVCQRGGATPERRGATHFRRLGTTVPEPGVYARIINGRNETKTLDARG